MSVDGVTPLTDPIEREARALAEHLLTCDSTVLDRAIEIIRELRKK